jgi:hypothetical protein
MILRTVSVYRLSGAMRVLLTFIELFLPHSIYEAFFTIGNPGLIAPRSTRIDFLEYVCMLCMDR